MSHIIYRIIRFEIVGPYTLQVESDDNTEQVIDFLPLLQGTLYGPLQNIDIFNQVVIDPKVHTLVCPMVSVSILRRCMIVRYMPKR
jgi:hypothetical protein